MPVTSPLAKTYTDRVLLAGDAEGFVNAFTAEGIFYAMTSGSIAADTALATIKAQKYTLVCSLNMSSNGSGRLATIFWVWFSGVVRAALQDKGSPIPAFPAGLPTQ